jgi:hypothetical protein
MKWLAFTHDGHVYDLSHLDSSDYVFTQGATGHQPVRQYRVWISFSHHCFTENAKSGDDPAAFYTFNKDNRSFDIRRYELSKHLPSIIRTLMDRTVSHTGHNNFLTIEVLGEAGSVIEYDVFFEVKRAAGDKRLHLIVQSAFPRDVARGSSRPRFDKVRFATILYNVQQNKPIKGKK